MITKNDPAAWGTTNVYPESTTISKKLYSVAQYLETHLACKEKTMWCSLQELDSLAEEARDFLWLDGLEELAELQEAIFRYVCNSQEEFDAWLWELAEGFHRIASRIAALHGEAS